MDGRGRPGAEFQWPRLCRRQEVRRLYVEQELASRPSAQSLSSSVARRRLIAGVARRPSFQTRTPGGDSAGVLAERAYLMRSRLGDLHVALRS